jgi:hypothetical protein
MGYRPDGDLKIPHRWPGKTFRFPGAKRSGDDFPVTSCSHRIRYQWKDTGERPGAQILKFGALATDPGDAEGQVPVINARQR